jgi:hypothetical protein
METLAPVILEVIHLIQVKDVYLNNGRFGTGKNTPEVFVVTDAPYNPDMSTVFGCFYESIPGWSLREGASSLEDESDSDTMLVRSVDMAEIPPLSKCIEDATKMVNEVAGIVAKYRVLKGNVSLQTLPDGMTLEVRGDKVIARLTDDERTYEVFFIKEDDEGNFAIDTEDWVAVKADLDAQYAKKSAKPVASSVEVDSAERSARAKMAQSTRHANIRLEKLRSEVDGWHLARA